jgi:DNA invertase Pin-like site-specific DNA recombinase
MTDAKIGDHHRARKAMLYVRQSSLHQVEHHHESRRLQYSMRERLESLGWHEVDVVDDDLGQSGASSSTREE